MVVAWGNYLNLDIPGISISFLRPFKVDIVISFITRK